METITITPMEALRRCVAVLKQVDYADCGESEALWCQHALALSEAEAVLSAPVVPVAAQPVVPGLEFVQAIANNFDSHDRENDEIMCRGCSAPQLWIDETQSYLITHRPECIVLRARAFLAAPQPAASVTDVAKDAERLDFIEANPGMHFSINKVGTARQSWRFGHFSNYPQTKYSTAREAIDAAIAAQQGEKT